MNSKDKNCIWYRNKFKNIVILILVCALTFFVSKYIQGTVSKEKISNIRFNTHEYDFKNLKQNKEASVYFVYENTGPDALKIYNISSRCGCTIPVWSRKELMPNEKDSILVTYDSKELGYFSKDVLIVSNSESSPDVVYIKGEVKE